MRIIPGRDCIRGIGFANLPYNECPNTMFSVGWGEDIDLVGGAAAIATLLGQQPNFRQGADDLLFPYDCYLKRLWYCDETVAGVAGALLTVDKGLADRQLTLWRQNNLTLGDNTILMTEWPGQGQLIPKGSILSMMGGVGGGVAEQHVCILDMHSPHFKPNVRFNPRFNDPAGLYVDYSLLTGALVVATLTGENDLLGHIAAYQDAEPVFGVDESKAYTVYALTNAPGVAATGVCGYRHPTGEFYFLRPTIFASAVTGYKFPMDQPWAFNGGDRAAPRLVGAGAVVTSTEFQPHFVAHGRMYVVTKRLPLSEIDLILQTITAKQLSATITIPQPGGIHLNREQTVLTLGHLSDERTGLHVRESRYDATVDREYYPVGIGENEAPDLLMVQVTDVAPIADLVPPAGEEYLIYGIQLVGGGAFAANRTGLVDITDGALHTRLWEAGAATIIGNEDVEIWPVDVSTYMTGAVDLIGVPGQPIDTDHYLQFAFVGAGLGEAMALHVLLKRRYLGGLRQ